MLLYCSVFLGRKGFENLSWEEKTRPFTFSPKAQINPGLLLTQKAIPIEKYFKGKFSAIQAEFV